MATKVQVHRVFIVVLAALLRVALAVPAGAADDPYLWLEDVEGDAALAWVQEQNERTRAYLDGQGSLYETLYTRLLAVMTADDEFVVPEIAGGYAYDLLVDADHPLGVWRRTPVDDFLEGNPVWQTLLDLDALAAAEGINRSFVDALCLDASRGPCLVLLSRGGADAREVREFDLETGTFVPGGFVLPEAKHAVAWLDAGSLLVAGDWGPESLTTSGYPFVVKRLERGTPLSEAVTVFEGSPDDVGVLVWSTAYQGARLAVIERWTDFFTKEYYLYRQDEITSLPVPDGSDWLVVGDQLVLRLGQDWHVGDTRFRAGSVVAVELEAILRGEGEIQPVFMAGERRTVDEHVAATRDHLLVPILNNGSSELYRFHYDGTWTGTRVPLPALGTIRVDGTSREDQRAFLSFSSFLQPDTLYLLDNDGSVRVLGQARPRFPAEGFVVEQLEALSADGTLVPYFVVRPYGMAPDGANPTLIWAYGGFNYSYPPDYRPDVGVGWLTGPGPRPGVYVLAHIRGGGELGPEWHRQAIRENRQRAFDDFYAVAKDLIARGITSPEYLGIWGASNGGLLTGVALTQRPDLFGAVISMVPLLDMKRYHWLLAGASWMAEYGDPDDPDDWAYLSRYSPYHNVRSDQEYPPVLFTTSTRDDRVHPGHARKMTALMESLGHEAYLFESSEGGHAGALTPEQEAELHAGIYAFLWSHLGRP